VRALERSPRSCDWNEEEASSAVLIKISDSKSPVWFRNVVVSGGPHTAADICGGWHIAPPIWRDTPMRFERAFYWDTRHGLGYQ